MSLKKLQKLLRWQERNKFNLWLKHDVQKGVFSVSKNSKL
jgi:hypothetical protein